MRLLNEGDKKEHPIDRHYHGLHCKLEPLDAEDDVVQVGVKLGNKTYSFPLLHPFLSVSLSFPLLLSPLFTYVPTFFLRSLPPSLPPPSLLSLSHTSWSDSTFDRPTQPPTIHTP